jgi:hypothetical protein
MQLVVGCMQLVVERMQLELEQLVLEQQQPFLLHGSSSTPRRTLPVG